MRTNAGAGQDAERIPDAAENAEQYRERWTMQKTLDKADHAGDDADSADVGATTGCQQHAKPLY